MLECQLKELVLSSAADFAMTYLEVTVGGSLSMQSMASGDQVATPCNPIDAPGVLVAANLWAASQLAARGSKGFMSSRSSSNYGSC